MDQRHKITISSTIIAILAVLLFSQVAWSPVMAHITYAILVIIFLGVLISNQQCEEDNFSQIERVVSAFLFSYIIFFRFLYAPISRFFLGSFADKPSFAVDLLTLALFSIFFFLFGTTFLVINTYSRVGFLSQWGLFNSEKIFFVFRGLFIAAVAIFLMFYLRNSFFSIKNSPMLNAALPHTTCNWTYQKYPNFRMTGRTVAGRDACLYNYAEDKSDQGFCALIGDEWVSSHCMQNLNPEPRQ